jgi:hypothetical protein
MFHKAQKRHAPGLLRTVLLDGDMIVNRPSRRAISGPAFTAQRSHLVPDEPDVDGNKSYFCKVADVSDSGFGVVCRTAGINPSLFKTGNQMTLEASDGKRVRVQIRWIKNGRLGLKVLRPEP